MPVRARRGFRRDDAMLVASCATVAHNRFVNRGDYASRAVYEPCTCLLRYYFPQSCKQFLSGYRSAIYYVCNTP